MDRNKHCLLTAIVDFGKAGKLLKEAKKLGATGGTIFLGRGTVDSHLLDFLGLNEIRKEILIIIAEKEYEEALFHGLNKKFHFEKPNHGIAFSMSLNSCLGIKESEYKDMKDHQGVKEMKYESIFTIVDKGMDHQVIEAAKAAGARGGTIIHARGSGTTDKPLLFNLEIDSEKEVVLILAEKEKVDAITDSIREKLEIDKPGKGIIFTMDVNRTIGLYGQ